MSRDFAYFRHKAPGLSSPGAGFGCSVGVVGDELQDQVAKFAAVRGAEDFGPVFMAGINFKRLLALACA